VLSRYWRTTNAVRTSACQPNEPFRQHALAARHRARSASVSRKPWRHAPPLSAISQGRSGCVTPLKRAAGDRPYSDAYRSFGTGFPRRSMTNRRQRIVPVCSIGRRASCHQTTSWRRSVRTSWLAAGGVRQLRRCCSKPPPLAQAYRRLPPDGTMVQRIRATIARARHRVVRHYVVHQDMGARAARSPPSLMQDQPSDLEPSGAENDVAAPRQRLAASL
jgi:hypothetical protein